jgi:RimJ/RimL family protein N-acetyltransferase
MTLTRDADEMQSERLILRRIEPGDLGFLTRLHADAEVARYLGHGRPRSPEESLSWLQSTLTNYDMFGLGQLAVLRKSDGRLIGRCGLSDLIVEIRPAGARSVEPGTPGAWFQRAQAPAGIEVQFEREL